MTWEALACGWVLGLVLRSLLTWGLVLAAFVAGCWLGGSIHRTDERASPAGEGGAPGPREGPQRPPEGSDRG